MKILSEIWNRFVIAFLIFVGGLVVWSIVNIVYVALMFTVVPLLWAAAVVVVLVRGYK